MRRHRRRLCAALVLLLLAPAIALAEPLPEESADVLDGYDLSQWEDYYETLPESARSLWADGGIKALVARIASGDGLDYASVWEALGGAVLATLRESIGTYAALIAVALLAAAAEILTGGRETLGDMAHFICFGMSAALVAYNLANMVAIGRAAVERLSAFMEIMTPVMSFALAAVGSVTLSGAVQPLMLFLNTTVAACFRGIVLPLTIIGGVLAIVGSLSNRGELTHAHKLIKSAVKWVTGAIFTLYFGIVTMQGLSMGGADSLALRAAKYTLDKSVPIIGSAVSGTLETVVGSAALIKNAAGAAAMLTLVASALSPLIQIACAGFACKAVAALTGMLGDARIPKLLGDMSEVYNNLFAAVTAVALMFLIAAGLMIAAGNP